MAQKRKVDPLSIRILIEIGVLVTILILLLVFIGLVWSGIGGTDGEATGSTPSESDYSEPVETTPPDTSPDGLINTFVAENGLSRSDYPDWLIENFYIASESRDFLLNYPFKYGTPQEVDISGVERDTVPLFIQWDDRWGYLDYGTNICGISGCGPTSLSMVAYYWTGDAKYTPVYMMQFAKDGGHVISTGGTDWSLFGTGAKELGFEVEQLPAVEKTVAKRLQAGIPVVVNVGPGTFTTGGHYMVLVGYEDGMFRINDPNSPEKSKRLWAWDEFQDQVRNFWAISLPEK